jgi:hypothetical protein
MKIYRKYFKPITTVPISACFDGEYFGWITVYFIIWMSENVNVEDNASRRVLCYSAKAK